MLADDRARRVFWELPQAVALPRSRSSCRRGSCARSRSTRTGRRRRRRQPCKRRSSSSQNILAQGGTFHDLLLSPVAWVDGEMARVYGLPAPTDPAAFAPTTAPVVRAGGPPDPRGVPRRVLARRRDVAPRARQRHRAAAPVPAAHLTAAGRRSLAADGAPRRGSRDEPRAVPAAHRSGRVPGVSRRAQWHRLRLRELRCRRALPDDGRRPAGRCHGTARRNGRERPVRRRDPAVEDPQHERDRARLRRAVVGPVRPGARAGGRGGSTP